MCLCNVPVVHSRRRITLKEDISVDITKHLQKFPLQVSTMWILLGLKREPGLYEQRTVKACIIRFKKRETTHEDNGDEMYGNEV